MYVNLGPSASYPSSPLMKSSSKSSLNSEGEIKIINEEENLIGDDSDWSADNDSSSTSLIEVTHHLEIDR